MPNEALLMKIPSRLSEPFVIASTRLLLLAGPNAETPVNSVAVAKFASNFCCPRCSIGNLHDDKIHVIFWNRSHSSVTQCRWGWGVSNFLGKKPYEGVRFNVISVTRGWVGVQFPEEKKCYVTLEWPHEQRFT